MGVNNKYRFSFTVASLLLNELTVFSKMIVEDFTQKLGGCEIIGG
jgi:hypothetical protein